MGVHIVEKIGDVKIYGTGQMGGKGAGLVKINECQLPNAHKLRTRVLTTTFFDNYINNGGKFSASDLEPVADIFKKIGNIPISVRSSATNEAWLSADGTSSVHAGENTSFMLPNNHADDRVRFNQLIQSIYFIYRDFIEKQPPDSQEKMAVVINPIPGIYDSTDVGPIYYPLVSGVANSHFPYALKTQHATEGFARIALGHGYATVLDEFPVISMATIKNPLPFNLTGEGQSFFYAIDLTRNEQLAGDELDTMKKLHVRFSTTPYLQHLGIKNNVVTFEELIFGEKFSFKNGLMEIMDIISEKISSNFQIEFVFNFIEEDNRLMGRFHLVQLTQLPEIKFEQINIPDRGTNTYLHIRNLQGHGIKNDIKSALIISPFLYKKELHNMVCQEISKANRRLKEKGQSYILIAPGRLGSKNREWGIQIEYRDVDGAAAIFEYGVDIAGRSEPVHETESRTGGIYGSHFLYMIQRGHDEEQKRLQTRMYGTQGTHFLTNLMSNNVIYGFIAPDQDSIDPWFFSPPQTDQPIYTLEFPDRVSIYADSINQKCIIISQ